MTKQDIKIVVDELRKGVHYPEVDDTPLHGLALPDFEKGKIVRKEVIVNFLNWQTAFLGGGFDEEELTQDISLLKQKRVVMV